MDYSVRSYLESKVGCINHANVDTLKSSIQREGDKMSMDFVSDYINAFHGRLERVIEARVKICHDAVKGPINSIEKFQISVDITSG